MKHLNDNDFFITLRHFIDIVDLSHSKFAEICPEIIKNLSKVPSMKKAFEDIEFPSELNIGTKTKLLMLLIQGLNEADSFHELVSKKS